MGIRAAHSPGPLLAIIAIGVLLAACSQQRAELGKRAPRPMYKVGAPYQIGGVWYYPAVDYNYDETGVASWYGAAFDQQYTANGEIFDLNQLTAAHRTLPMPSIVQVTNLGNGRSMRLRVNDRGPFARGRVLDVSRRASQLLGFETDGTALVRVKIIKDESVRVAELAKRNGGDAMVLVAEAPSVGSVEAAARVEPAKPSVSQLPAAAPINAVGSPIAVTALPPLPEKVQVVPVKASGRIFVQAGAFSVRENARRLQSRIAPLGSAEVTATSIHGAELYRVRLGPLSNVEQADRLLVRVIGSGYPEARIVVD
ncbi:MAG: septal ring lytic transglycosylase RlpA family protein [Stellaceae bacterium]|jgi:rare lipoprotein A